MAIQKFRKRPVEVEAMKWTGINFQELEAWAVDEVDGVMAPHVILQWEGQTHQCKVWDKLHQSWINVKVNDYVIKGVANEFYPHDGDLMFVTYEEVLD